MSAFEIARRLVDGQWRTIRIDEDSGGAAVTNRGVFADPAAGTSIANGLVDSLSWEDIGSPAQDVFDLTDPARPVVLAAGVYSIAASVEAFASMTVDGFIVLTLIFDADGAQAEVSVDSRLATAARPIPCALIGGSYYIPAGGTVDLRLRSRDGAQTLSYGILTAIVQRLS